jgi:rubredoxin
MFITHEMTRHTLQTKELRCALARCWNTGKTLWHSLENELECRQVQSKVCVRCINRVSMFGTCEMTRHTLHTKAPRCASARCWNTAKTRWHSLEHDLECRQVQAKVCVRCINRVSMFVTCEMTRHTLHTKELRCASARCWNTGKTRWHSLEHDLECRQVQAKVCVSCNIRVSMFVTREIPRYNHTPRN